MKNPAIITLAATLSLLSAINSQLSTVHAQGTAFTYQGRLNNGPNPANGSYDLTFTLFGTNSGGSVIAGPLTNAASGITNGLFTVTLDFGDQFPGADRWLQIGVRTNGGGGFATLSPRQALTAAPYAIRSQAAGTAATATTVTGSVAASQLTGAISSNNIAAGSISSTMLATGSVSSVQLAAGSVTTAALAQNAVTLDTVLTVHNGQVQATITDPATSANINAPHQFGYSMSTAGADRFVVGDPFWDVEVTTCIPLIGCFTLPAYADIGRISIYNTNGTLIATIAGPGGGPADTNHQFGAVIADAGGSLLVSAPGGAGASGAAVYPFNYAGAFIGPTRSGAIADGFGRSVAGLSNGLVLIGTPLAASGAVMVYNPGSSVAGGTINPVSTGKFGATMVSASGTKVVIGAPGSGGAVFLYNVPAVNSSSQITSITNPANGSGFGSALAMLGTDRVIIGAPGNPGAGSAYLYGTNGTLLAKFANPEPTFGGTFGYVVAAMGTDKILLGATNTTVSGVASAGAVYVFNTNGAWIGVCRNPAPTAGASLGAAVLPVNNFIGAGAFDLPNAGSQGSVRLFSLDGAQFISGLSVQSASITTDSLANGAVTAAKIGGVLNASQIPNLDASKISSGTLTDSVLSANIALRSTSNTFNGTQIITNGNVGIGMTSPGFPLNFPNTLGDKISLWGNSGGHYGFGIQPNQLQIHTFTSGDDVVFGYGQSSNLTETMRIKGTGNVGIGTTSPGLNNLQINPTFGSASGYGLVVNKADFGENIQINRSAGQGGIALVVDNVATGDASTSLLLVRNGVTNSSQTLLDLRATGNLGLGGVLPSFPLTFPQTLGDKLALYPSGGTTSFGFGIQSFLMQIHTDTSAADIAFGYGASTNLTENVRFKGNGQVGIGTTAPQKLLQVGDSAISGSEGMIHFGSRASGGGIAARDWDVGVPQTGGDISGTGYSFIVHDNGMTDPAQLMVKFGTGNVGVGTNAPQQRLHVVGNILATGTVTGSSDRNVKRDFASVDTCEVLEKVTSLPISSWSYIADDQVRHLGPMAQDFYAAFNVGMNDKTISMVDADGVALAAIQGLNQKLEQKLEQKETEITELKQTVNELKQLVNSMNQKLNGGGQ